MLRTLRAVAALTAAIAVVTTASCKKSDQTSTQSSTTDTTPPTPPPPVDERFGATLDGLAERPATVNTGATGTAEVTITAAGAINYTITATGLSSNPTGLHIHGPADANGSAGPIVVFDAPPAATTGTLGTGSIDAAKLQGISMDSLKTLIRNGLTYVNVHTANHKDGEIRGQLARR
jgi:hypothetical protein